MSFLMIVFKVIPYIVPFLKEMILGKKTWRQAFKENRGKTILTFLMVVSVTFNVVLTARVGTLAYRYLELSRAKQELEQKYDVLQKGRVSLEGSARHPIVNNTEISAEVEKKPKAEPTGKASNAGKSSKGLAEEVRADIERIRQREAAAEH
jgi:hypothetical protein